jgi:RimJ/RimL family protein N-acetyltransferase
MATETLKTGEALQVECVLAPDAAREPQILPFLGHKPPDYLGHIQAAFAGECGALETRFYIGLLDGEMVGNIMTVETHGIGIFGHVNTREDQRRKGICQSIMRHQMEDFRQRNGHVLLLGTGFQSPPYWIYHAFGFRDLPGGRPGQMRYGREEEPDFEAQWLAPAAVKPVPARWEHWPQVALLGSVAVPAYLRSLTLPLWGVSVLEGTYLKFLQTWCGADGQGRAAVLEAETGAVVAMATLVPDQRWHGDVGLLDVFAHSQVSAEAIAELIEALSPWVGKVQCYADPRDVGKIGALEQLGFRREAVLSNQFREGDNRRDAWLYARHASETPDPAA